MKNFHDTKVYVTFIDISPNNTLEKARSISLLDVFGQ